MPFYRSLRLKTLGKFTGQISMMGAQCPGAGVGRRGGSPWVSFLGKPGKAWVSCYLRGGTHAGLEEGSIIRLEIQKCSVVYHVENRL